jgi:hypothetical protein
VTVVYALAAGDAAPEPVVPARFLRPEEELRACLEV